MTQDKSTFPPPTVSMKLKLVILFASFKLKLHRKRRHFPSRNNRARVSRGQELWVLEFSLCGPPGSRRPASAWRPPIKGFSPLVECPVVPSHSSADLWTPDLGSTSSERIERKWVRPSDEESLRPLCSLRILSGQSQMQAAKEASFLEDSERRTFFFFLNP